MIEVVAWQFRPLQIMCSVVVDALRMKIRENAVARNKAIYLVLARCLTARAMLRWSENNEGAKFWMKVFSISRHVASTIF